MALGRVDDSFTVVADVLPHIIWSLDSGGAIEWLNNRWFEITGLPRDGDMATSWAEVIHPDDAPRIYAGWATALEHGTPYEFEYRLRDRAGEYRWFLAQSTPISDAAGRIVRWVGISTDTSEHVRARESLQLLADTVPQFLCTSRADGSISYANAQLRAYTGIDPTSIGFRWSDIVHPADALRAEPIRRGVGSGGAPVEVELRMRRADGIYRWFVARITAGADGATWYTSATDVHERKRAADALAYLDEASDVLSRARDLTDALNRAAKLAVPRIADWCAVYLTGDDGLFHPSVIHHEDPARRVIAHELVRRYPFSVEASREMIESRAPSYMPSITSEMLVAGATDPLHAQLLLALDLASAIVVPLVVEDDVIGMLHLVRGRSTDPFVPGDVDFAQVLAKRIAVAIDNAMVYDRARNVAHTFQSAALPRALPRVADLELDAVYVAGEREAEVGGDWYDAVMLDDGSLMLSIGDVAGKGLEAAVLMASLRQAIRVAALQGLGPDEILRVAQIALAAEQPDRFATAFVAKLAPDLRTLSYASAGHPPPVVRTDGVETVLRLGEPPLGVADLHFVAHTCDLGEGPWLLVCYTDGLTESTGDVTAGEALLRRLVANDAITHAARPAHFIRDRAVEARVRDDTAILTVRRERVPHWRFSSDDALLADRTRADLVAWLARYGEGDYGAAELIYGELIGNVVRHSPGPIDVDCTMHDGGFRLFVSDRGDAFDVQVRLPADIMSESGRGLYIISRLGHDIVSRRLPVSGHEISVGLPVTQRAR